MIKAVLVIKDKEPEVVEIRSGLESYRRVLQKSLSTEELMLSSVHGLDFFSIDGFNNVSGMVEEYSACHPYERNRSWHGPALFTEIDNEGVTITMSDETIEGLLSKYSLKNTPKSPSDFVNRFLEKHAIAEVYSFNHGVHVATLNTMDAVDMLLKETDEVRVKEIEEALMSVMKSSFEADCRIETVLNHYLKHIGKEVFKQQAEEFDKQFNF